MKKPMWLLLLCAPVLAGAQAPQGQFDGNWTTIMTCDASNYMPAYKWMFVSTIANGNLHGQHGEEHGPGYMVVDGPINADGSAKLHAKGTVQAGKAGIVTELKEIGRASCRERVYQPCRSRWSPYH